MTLLFQSIIVFRDGAQRQGTPGNQYERVRVEIEKR